MPRAPVSGTACKIPRRHRFQKVGHVILAHAAWRQPQSAGIRLFNFEHLIRDCTLLCTLRACPDGNPVPHGRKGPCKGLNSSRLSGIEKSARDFSQGSL